jgi:hypothetical protein
MSTEIIEFESAPKCCGFILGYLFEILGPYKTLPDTLSYALSPSIYVILRDPFILAPRFFYPDKSTRNPPF